MNSNNRKHCEMNSSGTKRRLLIDDELKQSFNGHPIPNNLQASTPIISAKQPLYTSPVDDGYGSFQSPTVSGSQTSPDSTNMDIRYSPEFLASVQAAMHIFQKKYNTNGSNDFNPSPCSAFARWNSQPSAWSDSEMLIQRLLTQLRSNMLKMVDNSLAQIECSLRSQNIDKESLLGYLGQTGNIGLPPMSSPSFSPDMSGVQNLFHKLPHPKSFMSSNANLMRNEYMQSPSQTSIGRRVAQKTSVHDQMDDSNFSEDYFPRLPASKLFEEEKAPDTPTSARIGDQTALNMSVNSILTTAHLKKAKLMFLYVRYPNSALLKSHFPNVKFNRGNTAQLIKWFSNFREFLYINVEKYIRQLLSNGVTSLSQVETLSPQHELMRVLLMHYNRGKDIETPKEFYTAVNKTIEEFFTAIQQGEDSKPSWKKPIYKIIAQYDQEIPECFK